jgi:hypothetical protein
MFALQKAHQKELIRSTPINERQCQASSHNLRNYLTLGINKETKTRSHQSSNDILSAAKSAIKSTSTQNQQPIKDFIYQKREMFYFQYMIDCKRQQLNDTENVYLWEIRLLS